MIRGRVIPEGQSVNFPDTFMMKSIFTMIIRPIAGRQNFESSQVDGLPVTWRFLPRLRIGYWPWAGLCQASLRSPKGRQNAGRGHDGGTDEEEVGPGWSSMPREQLIN